MTWKLWALVLFIGLVTGPALSVSMSAPEPGGIMLVIVPPWIDGNSAVEAAGGTPVGPVQALFGQFATAPSADFVTRVEARGAWAVMDGAALARICGVAL